MTMNTKRIVEALAVVMLLLTVQNEARATHKNWISKNTGNQCSFDQTSANEESRYAGLTWYPSTDNGTSKNVECPVSLGARWGSSGVAGYALAGTRTAKSMWANIYMTLPAGHFANCATGVRMASNSLYWSQSVGSNSAGGNQMIALMALRNYWGNTLQTHLAETVKSMDIHCSVPAYTTIVGYKVKLCQRSDDCSDGSTNDSDYGGVRSGYAPIQTSGIECTPYSNHDNGAVYRGGFGILNSQAASTSGEWVECPLTAPADDSTEHSRVIDHTHLFYQYGSSSPSCATTSPPTCPQCKLITVDRNFGYYFSGTFVYATLGSGYVEQPSSFLSVGSAERAMNIECLLPGQQTISGITSLASLTQISGGT